MGEREDTGEEIMLDLCNVFVKYLPHHFAEKELQELFQEFGDIQSVKVMVDPQTGSSLGYGFVRFAKPEQAQAAIDNLSRKKIGDRTLLCKLSNQTTKNAILFVKPLKENTTEDNLKTMFTSFGEVIECKVSLDKKSTSNQCVGFVRFVHRASAEIAIQAMNGIKTEGETLTVRFADTPQQKPRRYKPTIPPLPTEFVMVPQPVPVPYMLDAMGYPIPIPPMHYPNPGMNVPMLSPTHIGITSPRGIPGEFPFNIPPQFSEVGAIESAKVIIDKNTGDSKGYGFVQFVNHADAERALSMNGRTIGCKRLSVSFKTPSPRNSPRNSPRSPRQYGSPRTFFVSPR